ncbi:hypothetical protein [Nonomuraea roseoviolacea]|uniref:Transposase n=1 Tax=Nonomuraea roseoviolacea subsp. carminata TaxID=160689 RepID=A0ABT1JYV3_9ACTN|nr:hypothetical protein [Nonomuraea roseoviolacea]MCP2346584.1 hypothetical protein [Nonomuraea roseoviolacea subsp. carminata]
MIIAEPSPGRKPNESAVIEALSPKNRLVSEKRSSGSEKNLRQPFADDVVFAGQRRM